MAQTLLRTHHGRLSAGEYVDGILHGNRVTLARAITVVESVLAEDTELAAEVITGILPFTGKSCRIGITGVPGAGKSTFIDRLGMHLIEELGQKLAVLSVDPSSPFSGGSILGDKTRMERLSVHPNAFIRPSPSRGHLGGVSRRTRETILLCEAAGYANVFVETVGVGQSETAVRSMTDFFLLVMLAGAGDDLQGIKRGILEMIDGAVINKADGGNEAKSEAARISYSNALQLFPTNALGWTPRVLTVSSLTGKSIPEVWDMIREHRALVEQNGYFAELRREQSLYWMRELISEGLLNFFSKHPAVSKLRPVLEEAVRHNRMTPFAAAQQLLSSFNQKD